MKKFEVEGMKKFEVEGVKIDKRVNYLIGIDTETCAINVTDNSVNPWNMLVYDIGYAIVDKKGNVYKKRSFVVKEVFIGMSDLVMKAYYGWKVPMYWNDIQNGSRELKGFFDILQVLKADMKEYGVKVIFAHNARFDYGALTNTARFLSSGRVKYFYPYGVQLWDTLKMSHDTIAKQKSYIRYCEANGYMTKHKTPRPQEKAEVLYKYISGNDSFSESHTGLEDVLIETCIMVQCFKQHKKMRKLLFED